MNDKIKLKEAILIFYILLGSILFGIIVHETVHVIQFEGEISSAGIKWEIQKSGQDSIRFFVTSANLNIDRPISEIEPTAYVVGLFATAFAFVYGYNLIKEKVNNNG